MSNDFFSQFREVPEPVFRTENAGIYLLLYRSDVVYVGSSSDVPERVSFHASRRNDPSGKRFSRALWMRLPMAVLPYYEGAHA